MELARHKQPWIKSSLVDSIFILSPPFLALFIVMLFPAKFKNSTIMPLEYWVILIVMIDVAHVYSTLYRTYFNPSELKKQYAVFITIPLLCYIGGVILYSFDAIIFWRGLAYLAVFHFIRQQYGFMRIYSRKEKYGKLLNYVDTTVVYVATIYPLLYWHFTTTRKNFNWFVNGDFILGHSTIVLSIGKVIYYAVLSIYIFKEGYLFYQSRQFNVPKNLLVIGTFLSWYFGIIYYNGDMAFTTLNVVSHGIPYMALVWVYERDKLITTTEKTTKLMKMTFSKYGAMFFVGLVILFAYTEEGLWDGLIWKEHGSFFKPFALLPAINSDLLLALIIPLLALPQSTHYVLDGFIWRVKKE